MSWRNSIAEASLQPPKANLIFNQKLLISGFILLALGYGLINHEFGEIIISSIADAYIQVTSFVAATLFLFYGIERLFKIDLTKNYRNQAIFKYFLQPCSEPTRMWWGYYCSYPLCIRLTQLWLCTRYAYSYHGRCGISSNRKRTINRYIYNGIGSNCRNYFWICC